VEGCMALLLLKNEADCLARQHRQNPVTATRRCLGAAPYRASGLVHRPEAEEVIAKKRTPKLN